MTNPRSPTLQATPGCWTSRRRAVSLKSFLRVAACLSSLYSVQGTAAAADCQEALFSCEAERKGKVIEICATPAASGAGWQGAQYRYGSIGAPELVFPANAAAGKKLLFFSHQKRGSEYRVSVRFDIQGYRYVVFSSARGEHEGSAGVSVSKEGKLLSTVRCAERPQMFATYLREALACDLENPGGRLACNEDPFEHP